MYCVAQVALQRMEKLRHPLTNKVQLEHIVRALKIISVMLNVDIDLFVLHRPLHHLQPFHHHYSQFVTFPWFFFRFFFVLVLVLDGSFGFLILLLFSEVRLFSRVFFARFIQTFFIYWCPLIRTYIHTHTNSGFCKCSLAWEFRFE